MGLPVLKNLEYATFLRLLCCLGPDNWQHSQYLEDENMAGGHPLLQGLPPGKILVQDRRLQWTDTGLCCEATICVGVEAVVVMEQPGLPSSWIIAAVVCS